MRQKSIKKRLYLLFRLRKQLNQAAAIHCTSQRESLNLSNLRIRCRAIVEPNGVSVCSDGKLMDQEGDRTNESGEKVILFLGRITPKKGLLLLLDALASIAKSNAILAIAGPDENGHLTEVMQKAQALGLSNKIRILGEIRPSDLLECFRSADVFVLPSFHENFGNSVIEAIASGTPVVVSDQVDVSDFLRDKKFAQVVRLESNEIANALNKAITDTRIRWSAQIEGPPFVRENFSWEEIAKHWRQHYQSMIQTSRKSVR